VSATTIAEVVSRMRELGAGLPPADGVARFNTLYLAVTEEVETRRSRFSSPEFLTLLDVRFANLFFDALVEPPRAWAPLFEARGRAGIAPIQFALAGMNAHINRDLPVALVETCRELGLELRRDGSEHADFLAVNAVLLEVEARVKHELVAGPLELADVALRDLDDVLAMWNVARARDAAWTNAETLWALRDSRELSSAFLVTLDRMVGFAGRGLLRPAPRSSFLRRLWRRVRRVL
jgi:hypothetical protein